MSTALSTILELATPELQDHVSSCNSELEKRRKLLEEEREEIVSDIRINSSFLADSRMQRDATKKDLKKMQSGNTDVEFSNEDIEEKKSDLADFEATIADARTKHVELKQRLKKIEEEIKPIADYADPAPEPEPQPEPEPESEPEPEPAAPQKPETKPQKRKRELREAYEAMTPEERKIFDDNDRDEKEKAKKTRKDEADKRKRKLEEYDTLKDQYDDLEKRKNTMNLDMTYLKKKYAKTKTLLETQMTSFEEFLAAQDEPEVLMAKFTKWQGENDEELVD